MFRAWVVLFIVFVVYTCLVYSNCDKTGIHQAKPDGPVLAGWNLWQEKNCQSCHQLYGLGGYMGPDLTNTASDTGRDEKYMRTMIKYGTGKMPEFGLNDTEVNNLVAFLKWVDKSGRSRVPADKVTWTGNYDLDKER